MCSYYKLTSMVFMPFAQICLYITILYSMKKYKDLKRVQSIIADRITTNKPEHTNSNWKLLLDSPFSETGW